MVANYVASKFDMGVLRSDGSTKVGLMLRRNQAEIPQWFVYEDEYLAQQMFTGDPGYGALPPEKELAIRQDDWRAGLGLETYDANDPKRYHKSTMDMRFRGMGIAGTKSTQIATANLSATAKVSNVDMEATGSWTGGARSNDQAHAGTYSRILPNTDDPAVTNADMELETGWTGGARSAGQAHGGTYSWTVSTSATQVVATKTGTYTFKCWVWCQNGAPTDTAAYIYIDDGTSPTNSSTQTGGESWVQLTVSKAITEGETVTLGLVRSDGDGGNNPYFDDATLTFVPDTEILQDITIGTFSGTFTLKAWVYASTAGGGRIAIDDAVGETNSSYHTGTPGWEQISVTHTLDGSATRLRLELKNSDSTTAVYFDDIELLFGQEVTLQGIEFNDALYFPVGASLAKLNAAGDGLTFVRRMAASITSLEVMQVSGADYLFIALGTSTNYWYINTSESFTESNAVVKTFKYFRLVNAAAPTMWGSDGVNTIRSTVNPLNGGTAWSGQTTVDNAYHEITGLKTDGASLYIPKENRPYYLDSSGNVQSDLSPELETLTKSTDNGKNAQFWQAKFYIPWGDQSLLEYDSGTNTWRSPALSATNAAEYNGQVMAVYGDDQFLYAIMDYSTKVEILSGRLETIDGSTSWVWHCINETTLTGCQTAFISTIFQKRLYFSSTTASEGVYYIPLSTGYADVVNDANRSFLTGTTLETPWLHGNFKATTKAFPELELVMGHSYNANRYFTVKYKKIGDSGWTTIGNYTGSSSSMTQSKYIPADASSNNPKATLFKLQFTAVTNDTTITPILNNYHLKGILYPDRRKIIHARVYCANEIQLKDGTIDKGSYATIKATLEEARDATWPVTIYDIDGSTQTVKILPLPSNVPWYRLIANEKERTVELEFNVLMQVVSLS